VAIIRHIRLRVLLEYRSNMELSVLKKARLIKRAFFLFYLLFVPSLSACETMTSVLGERVDLAEKIASSGKMTKFFVETGKFKLVGFHRLTGGSDSVSVYIEGDGLAFLSRNVVSLDPTPRDPVGLRLAVRDPSPNVAYIARPCHFQGTPLPKVCDNAYWTNARFAPEVIKETNRAVDAILSASGSKRVRLFGFSGGGVLAALVAETRRDVVALVTFAAPLDHLEWTNLQKFTPLDRSLNPANFVAQLRGVKQIHFWGDDDDVVPLRAIKSFVEKSLAVGAKAQIIRIPDIGHRCCWENLWPDLYPDALS
jgi:predicted esterase